MEREIQVYEHHQDGQLVCVVCGYMAAGPGEDDFTNAPCGIITRGPVYTGAICDACTTTEAGKVMMDSPIVGEC